jgi:hypothetical protein
MSVKKEQKYNITILETCTNKKLKALGIIPNAVVTKVGNIHGFVYANVVSDIGEISYIPISKHARWELVS